MPTDIEITMAALDDLKKIQEYMFLAKKENAIETYAKLKTNILQLKHYFVFPVSISQILTR